MINGEGRSAAPKAKVKGKAGGGRGRGRGQPVQLQEDLPLEWLRDEGMMQHIVRVIMETRRLDFEQLKNDLQTRKDVTLTPSSSAPTGRDVLLGSRPRRFQGLLRFATSPSTVWTQR